MPVINKVILNVNNSCDVAGGTISASATSNFAPSGQEDYVSIIITNIFTGDQWFSAMASEYTSITENGLPNGKYIIEGSSTYGIISSQTIDIECVPDTNITITPNISVDNLLKVAIASNLDLATIKYNGLGTPNNLSNFLKNTPNPKYMEFQGRPILNEEDLFFLTVTATDVTGYSESVTIHYAKANYYKECGANQSGSFMGVAASFSLISADDAYQKALVKAIAHADANLVCATDIKFQEVSLVDTSFTISYSLENKAWTCLHDYKPDAIFSTANKVMSFKNHHIYLHNVKGVKGKYYDEEVYPSFIEVVDVNALANVASSIMWKSQYTEEGVIDESKTLTSVMLYNNQQCSGIVPVTLKSTTRNAEGVWRLNEYRDMVKDAMAKFLDKEGNLITSNIDMNKPFFKRNRFVGDYLCIRLIFDNLSQADFILSDFAVNARPSNR